MNDSNVRNAMMQKDGKPKDEGPGTNPSLHPTSKSCTRGSTKWSQFRHEVSPSQTEYYFEGRNLARYASKKGKSHHAKA